MFKKENNNITGVKKKKKLLNSEDRKDVLNNFKSFLELNKNTLKIDDLITTDFDLLVYAIQNNCPLPLIEFISEKCQKYKTSLNYETKQHEVPLFIAFENTIPKQRLNNTTDTTNDNNSINTSNTTKTNETKKKKKKKKKFFLMKILLKYLII